MYLFCSWGFRSAGITFSWLQCCQSFSIQCPANCRSNYSCSSYCNGNGRPAHENANPTDTD